MQNIDWNALKYILRVAESGSTTRAARSLGVNATTVMRKITAFEQAFGSVLFTRKQSGYETTLECDALVERVRRMEDQAQAIEYEILNTDPVLHGHISVSTVDSVMLTVLASCFERFAHKHPNLTVEVSMSLDRVNLNRKDADVAIRATRRPPGNVRATRLCGLSFGAYASVSRIHAFRGASLDALPWIGPGSGLKHAPVYQWMKGNIPQAAVRITADNFQTAKALAESGAGATLLPCCLGDTAPGLARLSDPLRELDTSLWIMVATDLEHAPRIKLFVDHVLQTVTAQAGLIEGRQPKAAG